MSLQDRCDISAESWETHEIQPEHLAHLRQHYDTAGDEVIATFEQCKLAGPGGSGQKCGADSFAVLRRERYGNAFLGHFWDDINSVPDWVDWHQIERGQEVFYRYLPASIAGFVLQGFVGENSTASGVVEVLVRTGGFAPRNLFRRLKETFQWLIEVTADVRSIKPGGKGHADTIRVRLLHAQVRRRILKLANEKPDYYDREKHGIPINTLDSIHSISTFCCSPMFSQFPKMGIYPSESEIRDYIALFRYLGHLLGVPDEPFGSARRAERVLEVMEAHESRPSATSPAIARNFVQAITETVPQGISTGFVAAGSRFMNGDRICDLLEIERPTWIHRATFRGFCWFAVALLYTQRCFPAFDRLFINLTRKTLHDLLATSQSEEESEIPFGFKFVPMLAWTPLAVDATGRRSNPHSKKYFELACRAIYVLCLSSVGVAVASCFALLYIGGQKIFA